MQIEAKSAVFLRFREEKFALLSSVFSPLSSEWGASVGLKVGLGGKDNQGNYSNWAEVGYNRNNIGRENQSSGVSANIRGQYNEKKELNGSLGLSYDTKAGYGATIGLTSGFGPVSVTPSWTVSEYGGLSSDVQYGVNKNLFGNIFDKVNNPEHSAANRNLLDDIWNGMGAVVSGLGAVGKSAWESAMGAVGGINGENLSNGWNAMFGGGDPEVFGLSGDEHDHAFGGDMELLFTSAQDGMRQQKRFVKSALDKEMMTNMKEPDFLSNYIQYAKDNKLLGADDLMGDIVPIRIKGPDGSIHEYAYHLTSAQKGSLNSVDDLPFTTGDGKISSFFQLVRAFTGGNPHKGTDRTGTTFVNPFDVELTVEGGNYGPTQGLSIEYMDPITKKWVNRGVVLGKPIINFDGTKTNTYDCLDVENNTVVKKPLTAAIMEMNGLTTEMLNRLASEKAIHSNGNSVTLSAVFNGQKIYFTAKHIQDTVTLQPGDTVAPGGSFGEVGSTGFSVGNHGHFEIFTFQKPNTTNEHLFYYNKDNKAYYLHQTYFNRKYVQSGGEY